MKKINFTMLLAMLLSLMLCFSLMAGCSQTPGEEPEIAVTAAPTAAPTAAAETTPATVSVSDEEMALMKCKAAIEDIQSYDSYFVESSNRLDGEVILNDASYTYYYRDGEDWLLYCKLAEDRYFSYVAYMCHDGTYYNIERDGAFDDDGTFHWGKTEVDPDSAPWFYTYRAPWLYQFDWDAQPVTFVSQLSAGDGESIRIQIHAPYAEDTEAEDFADDYTAELYFDAEGRFIKAVVTYYSTYFGSYSSSHICTETIQSIDPEQVAAAIDDLSRCDNTTCTICYG